MCMYVCMYVCMCVCMCSCTCDCMCEHGICLIRMYEQARGPRAITTIILARDLLTTDYTFINYLMPESLVFSCSNILFLVSLLFVAIKDQSLLSF